MTTKRIDPILVSVIGNALDGITREIGETMLRTSRSPIFVEARDFATSIFSADGKLLAQTHYIPVIGGATVYAQRAIIEAFGDDVHEGDVFIHNDPFQGGTHLPDITITRPVFWDGELVYWSMTKGHNADIGGGGVVGFNPEAREIWEEGIVIAPTKIIDRGVSRTDVWNLILGNIRLRALVESVLHCQVGATAVGERRLHALLAKYGPQTLAAATEELSAASERQVRAEIARIPDGTYTAERSMDNDGVAKDELRTIRLAVHVRGDSMTIDFTGSDAQALGFINSPIANTVSSVHLALFGAIDPDIRYNEGATRPIQVIAPEGSIVNPQAPAPVAGCTISPCETIVEATWMALGETIPELVHANWARWFGPATMGHNPRTGRFFADLHFMGKGGTGATHGFDGWDHLSPVNTLGGLRAPDPELHEMDTPYLLQELEYLPDSAGAGQWRGGLGVRYRWSVLADDIACATYGSGLVPHTVPQGLEGGRHAQQHEMTITRADGTIETGETNVFSTLNAGDVVELRISGGGGFGHPHQRDPQSVLRDVQNGVVSREVAHDIYGVATDPHATTILEAETAALRAG